MSKYQATAISGRFRILVHKSSPQWPKGIFVPVDTHVEFVEEVPKVVRHVETAVRVRVRQLLLHDVRHGSDGLNKAPQEKGNDGRTLAADLPRAASIHKRWCSRCTQVAVQEYMHMHVHMLCRACCWRRRSTARP